MDINAGEYSELLRSALRKLPDKTVKSYGISVDAREVTVNFRGDGRKPLVVRTPDNTLSMNERVAEVLAAVESYGSDED